MAHSEYFDQLLQYWHKLRKESGVKVPSRRLFKPMNIPKLLPYIYMVERKSDHDLVIRLSGTAIDNASPSTSTGANLLEHFPHNDANFFTGSFETLTSHPCGSLAELAIIVTCDTYIHVRTMALPLADEEGNIPLAIGIARVRKLYERPTEDELRDIKLTYIDLGYGVPVAAEKMFGPTM